VLAGTQTDSVFESASALLTDTRKYEKMARARNPFGDGNAAERIVQAVLYEYGRAEKRPDEFL
jgi:UDP-N-acetylglucosamine 2-epimerase (non-hydrolysing)